VDAPLLATLEEELRDLDRLLAVLPLVLGPAFLTVAVVLGLAIFTPGRVPVALLAARRAGFSGVITGAGAGIAGGCARLRPSPVVLASWDRRSE
jgi:hypothetical protein